MARISMRVLAAVVVVAAWMGADLLVAGQESPQVHVSPWTPGRITQVTLAVIESALLTFILLFPGVMDPIVAFINRNIGQSTSRRRREVESVVKEQAAAYHSLLLDALDRFEDLDHALSSAASID